MSAELWGYLAASTGWAVLGLVVGYTAGHTTVDIHAIARSLHREKSTVDSKSRPPTRRPSGQFVLGVVVVLLGVVTVVQGIVQNNETSRLTACQTAYSNGFADALDARTTATTASQTALDALFSTIRADLGSPDPARNPQGQANLARAIDNYLAQRAKARAELRAHPYPEPPREACR